MTRTAYNSTLKPGHPLKRSWIKSKPRKNKYNAKKIFRDDRIWDSTGEWERYSNLKLLERAGEISELECQPQTVMTKAMIKYRPDFKYIEDGRPVWEDFKGVPGVRFNLICKLWRYYGPGLLRISGKKGSRFYIKKEIMPEQRAKEDQS